MSSASDTINKLANDVNSINTYASLSIFESTVLKYIGQMKQSAIEKYEEYQMLNSVEPVDPNSTMAWASLQFAHSVKIIAKTALEIEAMSSAIINLTAAIYNKKQQLDSLQRIGK